MKSFKFERNAPSQEFLSSLVWRWTTESAFLPKQEFGVELELEGFGAELMGAMTAQQKTLWIAHNDPSLRGDATELVLRRPVTYDEFVHKSLPEFTKLKNDAGFKPQLSNRCSVHVHIDFAHKTVYSLCKFLTLYALLEDFFFKACGPERQGNHFCISLRENARFSEQFVQCLEKNNFRAFRDENIRYMALNLQSLWKFGSVEIRLHEGTADEDRLKLWVSVLKELVDYSTAINLTPDEIIRQSSMHGLNGFIERNLPTTWKLIKDVYYDSYAHTDTAQDFAFGVSWVNAPKEASVQPPKRTRRTPAQPADPGVREQDLARILEMDGQAAWRNIDPRRAQRLPKANMIILDEDGPF